MLIKYCYDQFNCDKYLKHLTTHYSVSRGFRGCNSLSWYSRGTLFGPLRGSSRPLTDVFRRSGSADDVLVRTIPLIVVLKPTPTECSVNVCYVMSSEDGPQE